MGLNLAANEPALAAAEARDYVKAFGRGAIEALEIGNEPNVYGKLTVYHTLLGAPVPRPAPQLRLSGVPPPVPAPSPRAAPQPAAGRPGAGRRPDARAGLVGADDAGLPARASRGCGS